VDKKMKVSILIKSGKILIGSIGRLEMWAYIAPNLQFSPTFRRVLKLCPTTTSLHNSYVQASNDLPGVDRRDEGDSMGDLICPGDLTADRVDCVEME
jgi:hypothetical protein